MFVCFCPVKKTKGRNQRRRKRGLDKQANKVDNTVRKRSYASLTKDHVPPQVKSTPSVNYSFHHNYKAKTNHVNSLESYKKRKNNFLNHEIQEENHLPPPLREDQSHYNNNNAEHYPRDSNKSCLKTPLNHYSSHNDNFRMEQKKHHIQSQSSPATLESKYQQEEVNTNKINSKATTNLSFSFARSHQPLVQTYNNSTDSRYPR